MSIEYKTYDVCNEYVTDIGVRMLDIRIDAEDIKKIGCPLVVSMELQKALGELSYQLLMGSFVDTKSNRESIVNDLLNDVIERVSKFNARKNLKEPLMIEDKTTKKMI